jgi:hypothetical protein
VGVGRLITIKPYIETWVSGKGGTKKGRKKRREEWGKGYRDCCVLWPLFMFGGISVVVVEGACVSDCKRLGLCTVHIVG